MSASHAAKRHRYIIEERRFPESCSFDSHGQLPAPALFNVRAEQFRADGLVERLGDAHPVCAEHAVYWLRISL